MTSPTLLTLSHITKSFGAFKANDDVSLTVKRGEIHALLGENGAGKSTLVKILYGVQRCDSGSMVFEGKSHFFKNPREARHNGVTMVYQHFSLFEGLSVLENIALGLDEKLDLTGLEARVKAILETYSLPLDPARLVYTLSVGERQRIEIVRCLLQNPKLLIMDEPTSVLTPQEVDGLFTTLRQLKAKGCSILYISHKLHEIKALCDTATVLRGGKWVATLNPRETTPAEMAEVMIGSAVKSLQKIKHNTGETLLNVTDLSLNFDDPFATDLKHITLQAKAGEVLGIAGVAGNGQSELALALSGEITVASDTIKLGATSLGALKPQERRVQGLLTLPEERNGHAAIPELSLEENTLLTARQGQLLNAAKITAFTNTIIAKFDVKTRSSTALTKSLSGGNIQKFLMGREILQNPKVLVVSQPTWGVDAGASQHIRQELIRLAESGSAVIVFSQDLDELYEISDNLAVMAGGKLSKARPLNDWTTETIGLAMAGDNHD